MSEQTESGKPDLSTDFCQQIGHKAERKLRAQTKTPNLVLSGLGVMGLIGWSVVVPTLLGALLGRWLDQHYPTSHSWSLALIAAGLCLGCWNAWRWISKENQKMHELQKVDHD